MKKHSGKTLNWEEALRILLTTSLSGLAIGAYADVPSGIVGGQNTDTSAYAAFVSYPSGNLTPISGLPDNTDIDSVAMNETGFSLIGGEIASTDGYAAFVSPTGVVTPLTFSLSGAISSTAINASGQGLIGATNGFSSGYSAFILSDATVVPLSMNGINSVSLNDSGVGLIGGEGEGELYAAYVNSMGSITPINTPSETGVIYGVAVNDLGIGIIGGETGAAYAAFVDPEGMVSTTLTLSGGQYIASVAINHSELALLGGTDESGNMYAVYATTDGTVTPLDITAQGYIQTVAMNSSGTGLIGGQFNSTDLYAAIVRPDGSINSLLPELIGGQINWVALSEAGVGLIGGQFTDNAAYAALVAPNGALTPLNISSTNPIDSVAMGTATLSAVTPLSAGPYLSVFYTQLAAASALEPRSSQETKFGRKREAPKQLKSISHTMKEISPVTMRISLLMGKPACKKGVNAKPVKKNSIRISPFGNYVHLKEQGPIPNYTNEIGGALLAYDYQDSNYIVGATLGYAFNYVDYSNGLGHGKVQEELACFYGAYDMDHFRFNGVLWGGLFQFSNTRHPIPMVTSKGKAHGWILSPHIEMASPWAMDQKNLYFVEPFFMLDWVNSWQGKYTESGSSGLNIQMKSLYSSLLQSEVGLRFYERFNQAWGHFCLEEKLSYINQAPFHVNPVTTSFVSSVSTFPIAVASTKVENLAALQVIGLFVPKDNSYPFGGFTAQVSGNSSYQSYFLSLIVGMNF